MKLVQLRGLLELESSSQPNIKDFELKVLVREPCFGLACLVMGTMDYLSLSGSSYFKHETINSNKKCNRSLTKN